MSEVCVTNNSFRVTESETSPGVVSGIGCGGSDWRCAITAMHLCPFRKHLAQFGSGPKIGHGSRELRRCTVRDSACNDKMLLICFIGRDRRFPARLPMYLPGVTVILRELDEVKGREGSQSAAPKQARSEELNLRRADGRKRGLQKCR